MTELGTTQQIIVDDSKTKQYFSPIDIQRYYKTSNEALISFRKLVGLGYFMEGHNRNTGEIVFISKSFRLTVNSEYKDSLPVFDEWWKCGKNNGEAKKT